MTGIQLLKKLPTPPVTIFTTAYRDYAYEGYELGVIDFLLKPISHIQVCTGYGESKGIPGIKGTALFTRTSGYRHWAPCL